MSRSLAGFLFFCLLLVTAGAFLVWYVGLTASAIAFDGERRETPYFLLQIVPQAEGTAPEQLAAYRSGVITAAGADGGRPIWSADTIHRQESRSRHGSYRGAVAALDVLGFQRGAGVLQMLTGADYRALASEAGQHVLLAGTSSVPQPFEAGGVAVVVLFEVTDATVVAPLGEPGASGWLAELDTYGGSIGWDAPIDWVKGAQAWNRVVVLRFPDSASAAGWLRDPVTLTGRAMASRYLGDLLVLIALPPV